MFSPSIDRIISVFKKTEKALDKFIANASKQIDEHAKEEARIVEKRMKLVNDTNRATRIKQQIINIIS